MFESLRDLLTRGIAAAKAGEADEARFFLEWVLRGEPPMEERLEAWYWLSEIAADPQEKRRCLEEVLVRDPANPRARRALAIVDGRLKPEEIVDPDRLPVQAAAGPEPADARRFVCPKCGGRMVFAPDGQALVCEYCALKETGAAAASGEQDFTLAMATGRGHRVPVAARAFNCQGCGTPFVLGPAVISVTCPYCGSAHVVVEGHPRELVPPDALIPFSLTASQASEALDAWLERKGLPDQTDPVQGLYLPLWTFDLTGQAPWSGQEYDTRRRAWYTITGTEPVLENDVWVPASDRLPAGLLSVLDDFDLHQARPYDAIYLSDWPAETYQRTMSDAALQARQVVFARCRQRVERGPLREIRNVQISSAGIGVDSFRLVLVPLWLSAYVQDSQRILVAVNGVSGKVSGERQKSGVSGWLGRMFGAT